MPPSPRELIPHRPPMLLLDAVTESGPNRIRAEITFRPGGYGVSGGVVPEPLLVECVAQAAAAKESLDARATGTPPKRGMLVGVDRFAFEGTVREGTTVTVSAEEFREIGPFRLIAGKVTAEGRTVAEGMIKIFLMEENDTV